MPVSNPIVVENSRPGTREWMLTQPRTDAAERYRCPWIEAYCSQASVRAGDVLEVFVSTRPASSYRVEIFRSGFYGGAGGRQVAALGPFKGEPRDVPGVGPHRVRECDWPVAFTVKIPDDWLSGVYLGKLTAEESGVQSYFVFIVKDERRADFIFKCSDTTWHAYNRWPDWHSLYDNGETVWYSGPDVEISLDRPITKYCTILEPVHTGRITDWHDAPLTTGSAEWLLWEFPFAYWMEAQGYDVTYLSCFDVHSDAAGLLRAKGLLSVGHDEYYTIEMYDNLKAAVAKGLSLAFFSGNTCNHRIELRPSARGVPNRRFARIDTFGPPDPRTAASFPGVEKFPHKSPSEGALMGARSVFPLTGGGDWICSSPEHWLYAGTGMKSGDRIPGLVGWEWHGAPEKIPGLQIVAAGKTLSPLGEGQYTATVYDGPRGNFVFNASTIWWGDALASPPGYIRPTVYTTPPGVDARVQRMTANVLERMRSCR
jgi:hypothetical protein